MATETDLVKLYSGRILALAADIPHVGRLDCPMATARRRSPQCGSTVTVDLTVQEGRIADFAQDVRACALGQASASVLGRHAVGCTRPEIEAARDALAAMLKDGAPPPDAPFEALEVLVAARDFANRHPSILLAWDATCEALAEAEKAA
ncbi:MAG: iron-sulfur cluster assembly scaffold protein [Paracoccaceae bacterium]|nr:iron-sulfur cluster assembly scaffold protein [Paracoccaceae bacterium]